MSKILLNNNNSFNGITIKKHNMDKIEPQIKIYYRYCELDKRHEYGIVCKQSEVFYQNYWIFWLWFRMGEQLTKKEKKQFHISAYNCSWDKNEKLIKEYKTVNNGVDRIVPAIRNHFKKLTQHG